MKITKYIILTLALASPAFSDVKIGYVDSNEIMTNFNEVDSLLNYVGVVILC